MIPDVDVNKKAQFILYEDEMGTFSRYHLIFAGRCHTGALTTPAVLPGAAEEDVYQGLAVMGSPMLI